MQYHEIMYYPLYMIPGVTVEFWTQSTTRANIGGAGITQVFYSLVG